MNRRERILTLLSGGQPDRIPWNGDLDWWMRAERNMGTLNPEEDGPVDRLKLHRRLGVGFYLQGHNPFKTIIDGVTITTEKNGNDTTVRYETPVGTVYETQRYLPTAFSEAYTHHLLEDAEDIPVLKYIWEHTRFEPDYELCNALHKNLDGYGVVLVYTPRTPFMQLVACDAGIENLVFAMMDDPEGFEELFEIMTKKYEEAAAISVASPADCVMIPENLSSEVVGKPYYEKYVAPFHRKWTAKIRAAGKYSFMAWATGILALGLYPKSPRSTFPIHRPYCFSTWSRNPYWRITSSNAPIWRGSFTYKEARISGLRRWVRKKSKKVTPTSTSGKRRSLLKIKRNTVLLS